MEHKPAASCELVSSVPSKILLIQMLVPVFLMLFNKLPTMKKKRQIVNETRTFFSLRSLQIRWIKENDKPTNKKSFHSLMGVIIFSIISKTQKLREEQDIL